MQRIRRSDEGRQRAFVPPAIRVLNSQQRFDAASHRRVVGVVAQRLKRDQRQRGRRGIEFPVGLPGLAVVVALAGIEAPLTVGVLNRLQPRLVLLQLLLNARQEFRRVVRALQLIRRKSRRRRLSGLAVRGRLRRGFFFLLWRLWRQALLNRSRALVLREVILWEEAFEKFD